MTDPLRPCGLPAVGLLLLAVSCGPDNEFVPPPPPEVTVAEAEQEDLQTWLEFTGTTAPFLRVEVRARVQGFLEKIGFNPGKRVEKDQLLFVIDPRPFEAEVARAKAQIEAATAQLRLAEATVERFESVTSGAIAEIDKIEARAQRDVSVASVASSEARLEQTELDLSYTEMKAPIGGRISINYRDIGNLVGQSEPTLLAEIVDDTQIYAWFNISEQALLEARKHRDPDPDKVVDIRTIPCELASMVDEGVWPFKGFIDYRDPELDTDTGTLHIRALFDNPTYKLDVGLFVRIRIPLVVVPGALMLPERALGSDQSGRYVLVVDGDDVVHKRSIVVGQTQGARIQIVSGLEPTDRIVVNGLQRARPGAKVSPKSPVEGAPTKSGQ